MSDLAVLFLHLVATLIRLVGPGGARAVVAESVLIKQQLLIRNRSRRRSPNLRPADRMVRSLWLSSCSRRVACQPVCDLVSGAQARRATRAQLMDSLLLEVSFALVFREHASHASGRSI
jgi:hypothetical protein